MLLTSRMRLVPATASLVRAEIEDRAAFARLLAATIPANWPPELLTDALPWFHQQLEADPAKRGWLCWYGLTPGESPEPDTLIASGGFTGPPHEETVEIGYSVLPQFQGQGYATEMMRALTEWAWEQPGIERIVAEARADNTPSVRLLTRLGFKVVGVGGEAGTLRYAQDRTNADQADNSLLR